MTRDEVLDLCSSLRGAVEDYPFGDEVAVFKVAGKMFALVSLLGEPGSVNLKCDPDWALELRATHEAIRPGYHQNKRHWNTVELDGTIEDAEIQDRLSMAISGRGAFRRFKNILSRWHDQMTHNSPTIARAAGASLLACECYMSTREIEPSRSA